MNKLVWGYVSRRVGSNLLTVSVALALVACGGGSSPDPHRDRIEGEATSAAALAYVISPPDAVVASSRCAASVDQYATVSGQCMAIDASPLRSMAIQAPIALAVASTPTADQVMDWAELILPSYFPDHQTTIPRVGFVFRYYPKADNYIGIKDDGSVYVLFGPLTESFRYVGQLANFTCVVLPDVCLPPTAVIAARQSNNVSVGEIVLLDGRSSINPAGDTLTFAWSLTGRPAGSQSTINVGTSATPSFVPDKPGAYSVALVVSNSRSASTPATVTLTASSVNVAPVATLGPDQSVTTGMLVYLDGSGSSDADNDALTYIWTLASKPVGSASALSQNGPSANRPFFSADLAGTYVVTLTVSDGILVSATATVSITASNASVAVVPEDACHPKPVTGVFANSPPAGWKAVIGWAQAMTLKSDHSASEPASIEIQDFDLMEVDSSGDFKPAGGALESYDVPRSPIGTGEGALFTRSPPCQPGASGVTIEDSAVSNGLLRIDLERTPRQYAHWWGNKVDLVPGKRYWIKATIRVSGKAAIQFGLDWWRDKVVLYNKWDPNCEESNNCEAWVSDWFGDTGGVFVTKTVPVSSASLRPSIIGVDPNQ